MVWIKDSKRTLLKSSKDITYRNPSSRRKKNDGGGGGVVHWGYHLRDSFNRRGAPTSDTLKLNNRPNAEGAPSPNLKALLLGSKTRVGSSKGGHRSDRKEGMHHETGVNSEG